MSVAEEKKLAAEKAVELIKPGMVVGLGTGSTVHFVLLKIAELISKQTLNGILCIPTSVDTETKARELKLPLTTLDENPLIDITIDGADEVSMEENERSVKINLIKGGGGALLREKIVAQASKQFVIIIDNAKVSKLLFEKWALPVEVIKFAVRTETEYLISLGGKPVLRKDTNGRNYITDEGNYILDTTFLPGKNLYELDILLNKRAGIVEHGLFLDMANSVITNTKVITSHINIL